MREAAPVVAVPAHAAPVAGEVLPYASVAPDQGRSAHWTRTFTRALLWWPAVVGGAKMLGGVAAWVAVMLEGGPAPRSPGVVAQPAFLLGLVICAATAGVVSKSWRLGAVLLVGAVAVAVADLAAPEPDAWAAGMPVAAAVAAALLLARALVPTRWGRLVFVSLLIIGVGLGVLAVMGLLLLAIVGFRAK